MVTKLSLDKTWQAPILMKIFDRKDRCTGLSCWLFPLGHRWHCRHIKFAFGMGIRQHVICWYDVIWSTKTCCRNKSRSFSSPPMPPGCFFVGWPKRLLLPNLLTNRSVERQVCISLGASRKIEVCCLWPFFHRFSHAFCGLLVWSSLKVDGQLMTMHHGDCLPLFGEEPRPHGAMSCDLSWRHLTALDDFQGMRFQRAVPARLRGWASVCSIHRGSPADETSNGVISYMAEVCLMFSREDEPNSWQIVQQTMFDYRGE